ncbi:hypothetical protein GCM10023185_16440 [Hymenobacter saemangeumensis]|uniref:Uncharacterized protein n=1 Tax=Hymenobacter saemangeumensis TaxID=1084522 RepID=A0ABP8I9Y7_9BACT
MRCLLFCLLLASLWHGRALAQASRPTAPRRLTAAEMQLMRSQPLLVMLQREEAQKLKKLAGNPAGLQMYRDDMAKVNAILRQAAAAWTLSPKVEYRYADQVDSLAMAKDAGQLNVLDFDEVAFPAYPASAQRSWAAPVPGGVVGSTVPLPSFRLRVFIRQRNFAVHSEPILGPGVQESDMLYCMKLIQMYAAGNRRQQLKTGPTPPTLLLCQDDRAADLTDAQIKQVYPYPYQFVSRADYEKAFQEGTPGYALVRLCWQGYAITSPLVFMPSTLDLVCGGDLHSLKEVRITQKDFKSFKKTLLQ